MPVYQRTRRKNARKAAILGVLARAERFGRMASKSVRSGRPVGFTYSEIAGMVGIYPIRQVARDLQRYHRFGYVRRCKMAGKFRYEITRRGAERLAYFEGRAGRKAWQKFLREVAPESPPGIPPEFPPDCGGGIHR